jgi:hypothetical protein
LWHISVSRSISRLSPVTWPARPLLLVREEVKQDQGDYLSVNFNGTPFESDGQIINVQ